LSGLKRACLGLAVLVGLAYASSLTGTFHFDDSHSVENNPAVRSLLNIPSFWTDARTSSFIPENRVYRPMVYTFYAFCWLVGGGSTWPFHLLKILMHWGVCVALFLIWRRLWSEPGWLPQEALALRLRFPFQKGQGAPVTAELAALGLACVFAVHPTGSECVDYISATTSLQCALFYVWAFWAYLSWRDGGGRRFMLAALFLYFLSVASKEEGITLPAMIFFTELFLAPFARSSRTVFVGPSWKANWRRGLAKAAPFAMLGVLLAVWIVLMRPGEGNESRGYASSMEYFMTQWRAYLWYMRLWFWPWDLNADSATVEFSHSLLEPAVIQAALGNVAILIAAWWLRFRVPAFLYGLVWFYVTISPASSVVVLAEAINEHRMYLSYVGFVGGAATLLLWMIGALSADSSSRASRLGWVFSLILLGLAVGTQERNRVWRSDETLWTDTVAKNPTSGRAYNNLALVYLARGDLESAIRNLEKCEQYWSAYVYCPLNRGIALQGLGRNEDAEKAFARAYSLNPRSVHANFYMGGFYARVRKDLKRAIQHYQAAIDLTGGRNPSAEAELSGIYAELQDWEHASRSLAHAIELEPSNTDYLFRLGRMEQGAGRLAQSEAAYRRLLEVAPDHLQGWYNLGVLKLQLSKPEEARAAFEKTVQLDPRSESGWFNLAFAAEQLKQGDVAVQAASRLVALYPQKTQYQTRLEELRRKFPGSGGS
jgi:tetratricopeptide (TPR) repeat protein